jgi:hypothetical protein
MLNVIAVVLIFIISQYTSGAAAAPLADSCGNTPNFNTCVLSALDTIHRSREGLGYDAAFFTRDLDYGPVNSAVKASKKLPKTMCVAAVTEVLIEALNIYYRNTKDTKPFQDLPYAHWNGSSALDIRDYMWENRSSHSAGYAFDKFGIGQKLDFTELQPGDFLSFDRLNKTGHSVIFLGYLDKNYNVLPSYSSKVAGFKYYSSQSSGISGFAYRWAFFSGADGQNVCNSPNSHPNMVRDCFGGGIVRAYVAGRGGRLWNPPKWHVKQSTDQLVASLEAIITPVIEQQYTQQIADLAKILSNETINSAMQDLDLSKTDLSPIITLPGFPRDKFSLDSLAKSPTEQRKLLDSPELKNSISKAVSTEISKPGPGSVDQKFLVPEDQ